MRITADPARFGDRSEITAEEFQSLISGGPSIVPPAPVDAVPDWQTNEKAFQAKVVKYAREHGFRVYHTYNSASSAPGFPDLFMVRGDRALAVELKVAPNKPTKDQWAWLKALMTAGIDAAVWYPDVWDEIEEVLR